MKNIVFELSPGYIFLCFLLAAGYAVLLYRTKNPWSQWLNRGLFTLRLIVTFFLAFFLLAPIVKQISNVYEKPVFVILQDNSRSIREVTDTVLRNGIAQQISATQKTLNDLGYETVVTNFDEDGIDNRFELTSTNIHESLRGLSNRFEGRNLSGVVLVSDGIYNAGLSPLYGNYNYPVYTVGVGDTTQRADLLIKNLAYNKIAYQGNKFPIRADVMVKGFSKENIFVSLTHKGKIVDRQTKSSAGDGLLTFDFEPLADEQGIQRYDIQVDIKPEERNTKNNRTSIFIEVVEGKKKILLVSAAPHPDIKALRAVIEQNSNFEFILHVPRVEEATTGNLLPENIDLAIFYQVPDTRGQIRDLFQRFAKSRTSLFLMVGPGNDLTMLGSQQMPVTFEQPPRQYDEVTPVVGAAFSNFTITSDANSVFAGYPPVQVHFGKIKFPIQASTLLLQKVGSLVTEKPLLYLLHEDTRKIGVLLGEGIWRWRLHEFSRTEKTESFDEVFGKLVQYLSTSDDKSKFRSYPVQQQFSDIEPVIFESQVYNDIYESVYGNTIELEITDEQGKRNQYSYITSPGNTRYPIGGLKDGVYRYKASTVLNTVREEVRGQFSVVAQQLELQSLTADFELLRNLSKQTLGTFYKMDQWEKLQHDLRTKEAQVIIRSEERYDSLINLKGLFFLLLILVSGEWFLRKYFGSY